MARARQNRGSEIERANPADVFCEAQSERAGAGGEVHGEVFGAGMDQAREQFGFRDAFGDGVIAEDFGGLGEAVADARFQLLVADLFRLRGVVGRVHGTRIHLA